ncbi:MAG TPA: hypothetical protein VLA37_07970 [Sphingomonadaceae bacterium]|nr:hypothetical protein [Sphingomonadaceae bacterium]
MSVDFVVFDPAVAPREGKAFRSWYEAQVDWDLESDPAPEELIPPLLQWYQAMVAQFPDMIRNDADGDDAIDYSFTPHFMYCSMAATKAANAAWSMARAKAAELGLGTYDCMSDDGRDNRTIVFPEGPLENAPSFLSKLFGRSKD